MKKQATLLLFSLLVAGVMGQVQAQVEWLTATPSDNFFCVSHPEQGVVFLGGEHAVYKSNDNGDTWETAYTFDPSTPHRFFGMWFLDGQTGFASGAKYHKNPGALCSDMPSSPCLFKTEDGGLSWQCVDSSHSFVKIQAVSQDTLFALESQQWEDQGRLYKSVDGGHSWECILLEDNLLHDFSVVNGHIVYALHGSQYFNEQEVNAPANPTVYKSVDGGISWTMTKPLDTLGSKGPLIIDQIYFYEDGEGALYGHNNVFTINDFETYEFVGSGFSSFPDCWNFQSSTLKNGFQVATSWDDVHMDGYSRVLISRDFGRHRNYMTFLNSEIPLSYLNNVCSLDGSEADTTFFIVTRDSYYGKLFRAKGTDFPNVGVQEKPIISIKVSPNPSSSLFAIASEIPINKIEVYDCLGQLIVHQSGNNQSDAILYASAWRSGTYILHVYTEKGVFSTKIVKR